MIKTKERQTMHWYWSKQKKNRQYNGQNKRRTDNAMAKGKGSKRQTMIYKTLHRRHKKNRRYNGQDKRRTDNALVKRKE
jgi:hypothetical protein